MSITPTELLRNVGEERFGDPRIEMRSEVSMLERPIFERARRVDLMELLDHK